jgi:hypothetical protein
MRARPMAFPALVAVLALTPLAAAESPAPKKDPALKREDFRYDGKTFDDWARYMMTELKSEKRIDAIRAMVAFATRGYADEASAALVDMLKGYQERDFDYPPAREVLKEVETAVVRIGVPAVRILLRNLNDKFVLLEARGILGGYSDKRTLDPLLVPEVVRLAQSDDKQIRQTAVDILAVALRRSDSARVKTALIANLDNPKSLSKFVADVTKTFGSDVPGYWIVQELGPKAANAVPELVKLLKMTMAEHDRLNKKEFVQLDIMETLAKIGPGAREALPVLNQLAAGPRGSRLGEAARAAIDAIQKK